MIHYNPLDLLLPTLVILLTILFIPITALTLLKDRNIPRLTSYPSFQRLWFAQFWHFFGAVSKPLFAPDVESILPQAYGTVLEVGSGSGDWMYLFAPERNPRITKLILLEPNRDFHETLRRRAEALGLAGRFEVVGAGVGDMMQRGGVEPGSIDTISTVHVLCSVPGVEGMVGELYKSLKPGGQWLVYEHVKVRDGASVAGICQSLVNVFWPVFLDGCSLTRRTEDTLRRAGKWESVELRPGTNQGYFEQLPHIRGRLVKAERSEGQ